MSSATDEPTSPAVARLVDTAGRDVPATPREVADHLQAGTFFWIDLQNPHDDELAEFSRSLRLPAGAAVGVRPAGERSSFARTAEATRVVLPAAASGQQTVWLEGNVVTFVLTEEFLLTVHLAPCEPLLRARREFAELEDEDARADRPRVLFLVLDVLIASFKAQLLALDDRLGEIQLGMLSDASPAVHDELVSILGVLTDGIQELGWYWHDLEEIVETVDRMPGMREGAQHFLDRHRQRVARMRENGKEIRDEAKDAFSQYSQFVAGRQAQVVSTLTIVATVFLPLTFLTGYFGMNFAVLTGDVQNRLWQFVLLGLVLPVASASFSLLLVWRLERRFGIGRIGRRPI